MTMISYAQNGEDVMLMRAFAHVANGFYIDVGAQDPTVDSVTRAFYDRGWHGVNVEPSSEYFSKLVPERPRDICLQVALDATEGTRTFHQIQGTGLSTLEDALAERHGAAGWPVTSVAIGTSTLASLCERYAAAVIHFLKVDVEGLEEQVLRGADFTRFRPWIVVVEATRPLTQETSHEGWEPILTQADYAFIWFDGLNRYYLAAEQAEALRPAFSVPLNYFDDYVRYDPGLEKLRADAASAATHAAQAQAAAAHAAQVERECALRLAALDQARAEAEARASDAAAGVALIEARLHGADALAQAADANAKAAEAQAHAAHARLGDLRHDIDETRRRHDELRHREEAARALLGAQQSNFESRIALMQRELDQKVTAHDRLVLRLEAMTVQAGEREAELARLAPPPSEPHAPATQPAPATDLEPAGPESVALPPRRRMAARAYGLVLRPLVRPLAWRSRSFLVDGVRQVLSEGQSGQLGRQEETFHELRARADKIVDLLHKAEQGRDQLGEAVGRVQERADDLQGSQRESFVELRSRADKVVDANHRIESRLQGAIGVAPPSAQPAPAQATPDLAGLVASMEAALLSMAVVGSGRGR